MFILVGLFSAHSGDNCSQLESEGFQQLSSTLAIVQTLRNVNYIPGINIGLYRNNYTFILLQSLTIMSASLSVCLVSLHLVSNAVYVDDRI